MESGPVPTIDESLARELLEEQFPQWAGLPLVPLDPGGSDHVIFRLGDSLSVRLPRGDWAAGQALKEAEWLPRLAPLLPLEVPSPVGTGTPALGYPWHWSVHRWLRGETVTDVVDQSDAPGPAAQLADFVRALHRVPTPDRASGSRNNGEDAGGDGDAGLARPRLSARDASTRAAIAAVADTFDAAALLRAWEDALAAPAWEDEHEPVWCHGDLHNGNLLIDQGRLTAVIDFGSLGIGDPAIDLMAAYTLLSPRTREVFRQRIGLDGATWARGRGWALTTGLNAYTSYADTHPHVARQTYRQITQVWMDHAAGPVAP
ncbi:aminoglycoside phosphotransferase family protein [Streptomyces sp. XM4193]|uniref:aminoglycoside phosphotransferase family protein n=1 Tax=Streptomyces sp. XM4193 TaxID=2929782 RepID=UPI001FF8B4F9|nr:aminoglycoside phosphotransferase family protein [Streptomyces sp. XM4193]MCK1798589.1 aminoglycoside phosphotransferase family protein [Streptomyces sp. XM4193]